MKSITTLTRQETAVLALIAKGWRNAAIARELFISIRTVESHVYNIFSKLGVTSRTEAAILAFQSESYRFAKFSSNSDEERSGNDYPMGIH